MQDILRMGIGALFLNSEAYEEMRSLSSPFVKGLILIVIVGIVVGLVGIVGEALEWASIPRMGQIRQVVDSHIARMEWYQKLKQEDPDFVPTYKRYNDLAWQIFPAMFGAPNPVGAALDIVLNPIAWTVIWVVYALMAYLFARLLGGQGSLSQTFGCTALAVTPQLLNLIMIVPFVEVGGIVTTWTLVCNYLGVKTAHRLSWGRALWATILPPVLLGVVALILSIAGFFVIGALTGGGAK
jgi:hypothetical protein